MNGFFNAIFFIIAHTNKRNLATVRVLILLDGGLCTTNLIYAEINFTGKPAAFAHQRQKNLTATIRYASVVDEPWI